MDDGLERHVPAASAGIPLAAWLLLGVAAITLGVHVAMDWYQLFGPYLILRPEKVFQAISSVAPFLLAAAVLVGAVRWPAGRPWLAVGAAALALFGVLELVLLAWIALWLPGSTEPMQAALIARAVIVALASLVAPLLLAMGLRAARHAPPPDGMRRTWMLVVGVIGLAAVAGGMAIAAEGFVGSPDSMSAALWVAFGGMQALAAGSMALLAVAALRSMSWGAMPSGGLPELLIAVGATIGVAVSGWTWWFQFLTPLEAQAASASWVLFLPRAIGVVGVLVLIAGFAAGRLFREPARTR